MRMIIPLLALSLGAACGTSEPPPTEATPTPTGTPSSRLLPAKVGATWTYRVTDLSTGAVATKTSAVEAIEDVGGRKAGITAYRFRTEKSSGWTVSWQEDRGTSIVRHRELSFDAAGLMKSEEYFEAFKTRVDETHAHTAPGAAWEEAWTEVLVDPVVGDISSPRSAQWTVESAAETITVPAGTFTCVRVRRVSTNESGTGSDKTFWFAPGVGKVKETGGKIEELLEYAIP